MTRILSPRCCLLLLCCLLLSGGVLPAGAIDLLIKKGSTTSPIPFALMDAATGQIGQTGQTGAAVNTPVSLTAGVGGNITVTIWQAGGTAYANATGTITERGNGIYHYTPVAADTSSATATDNVVLLHITCSGCQTYDTSAQVVAFDPNDATRLGIGALPNAAAGASGGLPIGNGSGQVVASNTLQIAGTTPLFDGSSYLKTDVQAITAGTIAPIGFFGVASSPASGWFANLPNVTIGGYAANEDPAYLLFNSTLLSSFTTWATGSYGYYLERTIGSDWGGYTRNPVSGVITFTMPNGQTFTATVSVNSSGQITGRVTN